MNAVFLKRPDGTETDISICTQCGTPARGKSNFDISQRCCTCWECGNALVKDESVMGHYHQACELMRRSLMETARIEKATLVEKYGGPVFANDVRGGQDGYFNNLQELSEAMEEDSELEFAYCCKVRHLTIDLDSVLENLTEEAYEDAFDDLQGVDELATAVDKFNAQNADLTVWDVDYSRKVKVKAGAERCRFWE